MKSTTLRLLFTLSLLVNAGVRGAFAYRAIESAGIFGGGPTSFPGLVDYLDLSDRQQRRWHEIEAGFLQRFEAGATAIHERRDRLLRQTFAESPDSTSIESERAAIARLQKEQQQLVIEQLLAERALLDPRQRERLLQLLLSQPVEASGFQELHRH